MEICGNMMKPIRKLWSKVAKKVGLRKSEHGKLRRDVLSCEYEDVRILWEMLKRNEGELARSASEGKRMAFGVMFTGRAVHPSFAVPDHVTYLIVQLVRLQIFESIFLWNQLLYGCQSANCKYSRAYLY